MTVELSRRTVLAALGSIALGAEVLATPATHFPASDTELIALGNRFDELEWHYRFVKERDRPRNTKYSELLETWRARSLSATEWDQVLNGIHKQLDAEFGPAIEPDILDVTDRLDKMQRRIMVMPVATLAGLAVKARVARFGCKRLWDGPADDLDPDQMIARKLIDDVLEFCTQAAAAR